LQDLNNPNISNGLIIDFSHASCEKSLSDRLTLEVASQVKFQQVKPG
jgi:3-deoxy-D-arabino-heptulosonate 7-phosphate (DAHP) synthase